MFSKSYPWLYWWRFLSLLHCDKCDIISLYTELNQRFFLRGKAFPWLNNCLVHLYINIFIYVLQTRVTLYQKGNCFLFSFVSSGIPREVNFTHFFFYWTFRITPFIKTRSHFRSVLSKILRLGTYPTNPQALTKYYRSRSVIRVWESIMKVLMSARGFNMQIRFYFTLFKFNFHV